MRGEAIGGEALALLRLPLVLPALQLAGHVMGAMFGSTRFGRDIPNMLRILADLPEPTASAAFTRTLRAELDAAPDTETARLIAAIRDGQNQYPPGPGLPVLRQAIAHHQQRFYGLSYDPDTEVLVTAGATEALAASLLALVRPGDEVVPIQPPTHACAWSSNKRVKSPCPKTRLSELSKKVQAC